MSDKQVEFKGRAARCVYSSPDFKTYAMDVDINEYPDIKQNKYRNVSIIGNISDLTLGVEYEVTATEEESKYGTSYRVTNIRRNVPTTAADTKIFLEEILTANQADVLYKEYPNIIDIVKNNRCDKVDLDKLHGIGEKTFEVIKNKIIENFKLADLVAEFKGAVSLSMLKKIYDRYSDLDVLREKLKTEPYKTLTRISGVGFKTADSLILDLQKESIIDFGYDVKTSEDRCLACIVYLLQENEKNGNTRANLADIRSECIKMIPSSVKHFANAIQDDAIYYSKESMSIALKKTYEDELYIAKGIKHGLSVEDKWDFDWKAYQHSDSMDLSDEQIELLHCVCEHNVVILSGSAGAGKSASTEALIKMLRDNNKTFVFAAPTGKSAKVLSNFSNVDAKTIHRALCYVPGNGWGYNSKNKLDCDVLLLDEMSMISVDLMRHVIDAIDFDVTKLVMIGDPNQLPSVQAGNVLHDFLSVSVIPTIKLTKIFRYGSGGILTAATNVNMGKVYLDNNIKKMKAFGSDNGYVFVKSDDENIVDNVLLLYKKLITNGINGIVYKPEDIAVLTAYNKGEYGTLELNNKLQKIANKNYGSENSIKYGSTVYYIGDIVMQCSNDYRAIIYDNEDEDAFVANGESSVVKRILSNGMVCNFGDLDILCTKDKLINMSLSYSYSIHKSQGDTVKIVMLLSPRSHVYMNSANLLYVGITRASDKCFHFGLPSTINMSMKKKENFNRKTFMRSMLTRLGGI